MTLQRNAWGGGDSTVWQYIVAWLQLGRIEKLLNRTADALDEASQHDQNNNVSFDIEIEVVVEPEPGDLAPTDVVLPNNSLDVLQLTHELLWQLDHGDLGAEARNRIERELIELNPDAWRDYQAARWV